MYFQVKFDAVLRKALKTLKWHIRGKSSLLFFPKSALEKIFLVEYFK